MTAVDSAAVLGAPLTDAPAVTVDPSPAVSDEPVVLGREPMSALRTLPPAELRQRARAAARQWVQDGETDRTVAALARYLDALVAPD